MANDLEELRVELTEQVAAFGLRRVVETLVDICDFEALAGVVNNSDERGSPRTWRKASRMLSAVSYFARHTHL